ncbi:AMP-binding protein [Clostridium sp. KNHs205]|uniref:phenylacetate--CoA ligase family protein n=1 Tax=Clostridium sp. KNHs205 TaxID=1449050 RepID=UPI00068F68AE|nr:AMP-binding protein [Clostridium sp. KNHs205]
MGLLENMDLYELWDKIKERIHKDRNRAAIDELESFPSIQAIFLEKYIRGIHHRAYYIGTYQEEETVEGLCNFLSGRTEVSNLAYGPSYIAPKYYEAPGWWISLNIEECHIELFIVREFGKWLGFDEKKKQSLMSHCAIELRDRQTFYSCVRKAGKVKGMQMLMFHKERDVGYTYTHLLDTRSNKVIEVIYTYSQKESRRHNYFLAACKQKERDKEILQKVEEVFYMSDEVRQEWQDSQLRRVYRNFYGREGYDLKPEEVNRETIKKLPFMTREMLKEAYPLKLAKKAQEELVRYGESTGTTKNPISAYYSVDDWHYNNAVVAGFLSEILEPEDKVMVVVPYSLAMVAQDVDRALESIGTMVIPVGTIGDACNIDRAISILKSTKVSTIVCSPTRALYIAYEIKKRGYDVHKDFSVNKIFCVGEGTSAAKTEMLQEIWKAKVYPMYGMTETNTLAMPCTQGKLHLAVNKAFFEVVDHEDNDVGFDRRGELVVTTFFEGMPLLRYKTGDICTVHSETCSCGLNFHTIEHHGRKTDSIKLGNAEVPILDLEQVILKNSPSMFYSLTVNENEVIIGLAMKDIASVQDKLKKECMNRFHIEPVVESIEEDVVADRIKGMVKPCIASIYRGK